MAADDQKKIDLPTAPAAPATPEPLIYVMPERYRGGHTPMAEPKKEEPKPAPKPAAPAPPKPPPMGVKPLPGKKKSNAKVLVLAGALLLFALGLAGFFLLQTLEPSEPEPGSQAVLPPPPGSEPSQSEPPPPETTPEPADPFAGTPARPGIDSDSDGLTDVEEQILYATDPFLPDTDADGFLDGNEVFHRYNPKGTAPSTLETAGLVRVYNASVATGEDAPPYEIFYPSAWSIGGDPVSAGFLSTTGERILLVISAKDAAPDRTGFRPSITKNGLPLFMSEDQLTAQVEGEEWIVTLTYDRGVKGSVDYLQTFQMMLNSISFP